MRNLISKNEKIFIAGANGMVGSAINKALLKKGYGDQSKGGMCTLPRVGAVCTYGVRSKLQLMTDDGDLVKLQPIGRFQSETMTVPVGPQSFEELDDLDYQPLPLPDLA